MEIHAYSSSVTPTISVLPQRRRTTRWVWTTYVYRFSQYRRTWHFITWTHGRDDCSTFDSRISNRCTTRTRRRKLTHSKCVCSLSNGFCRTSNHKGSAWWSTRWYSGDGISDIGRETNPSTRLSKPEYFSSKIRQKDENKYSRCATINTLWMSNVGEFPRLLSSRYISASTIIHQRRCQLELRRRLIKWLGNTVQRFSWI